jgi:glycosyltransferase involved in cell wall biosynthesis
VTTLRVAATLEQCWHRVPGGTGRATVAVAAALAGRPGIEVVGVAAWHPRARPALEPPVPVRHHRLPRRLLYEGWHRAGWPRASGRTGPIDVIWAGAMAVPPAEVPVVATVHDLAFLEHPEWSTNRGLAFFRRSWDVTLARATVVVVPSATTADACVRHGLDPGRIVVVPWGVDQCPVGADAVARVRRSRRLPERFVLWVGTAEPRKNLPGLVAALAGTDLALVVVGPAGWRMEPDEVLAPLGSRVLALGALADDELRAVYAAACVFALPSHAEGFGLPVLEAMVQGTPVVTSARTGTADAAGDAAVLVDAGDPAELRAALVRLVADDAARARLGAQGRERARAFTWEAAAEGYERAFRRAVAGASS